MIPDVVAMFLPVPIDPARSSLFLCPRGDVLGVVVRKHGQKRLLKFRQSVPCDGNFAGVQIDCEIDGNVRDIVCSVCLAKRDWYV